MIPYSRQTIGADDIREVVKTLKSPFLTQGPKVAEFEKAVAKYTGTKYAVTFSNGTTALHAAYAAAGIGAGDEVILPALTFAATSNAALYLGAKPVFADSDPDTGNLDPVAAEKKITSRTKAIVVVDYAGNPADLRVFRALAKKHKLVFIEDGAQSLGSEYRGRSVGSQADMTMFSFHPVKSITTGEGGIIVTNNRRYFEILMMFRTHGITKDPKKIKDKAKAAWHQEMHILGNNYRLTDIQAALGVSQMRKLDSFIEKRRNVAKRYFSLLKGVDQVSLPPATSINSSAWHLFVVRVHARIRDEVYNELRAAGVGVQVHYLPVYHHPYYQSLGYSKGLCPEAEKYSFSAISLPLFPTMTIREQDFVVKTLVETLKKLKTK